MTTTNDPVREATGGELTKYRANGQASKLGLVIHTPTTVYSARINQTFATLDKVVQLTYDAGSGTLANVKEGMTMYVGSGAGLRDKGIVRIRKTPTSSIFYIGETSDIQFADNDYLTVIDSFLLWNRPISDTGGVVKMDHDIEYGDLTRGGAIPRLGPLVAVIEKTTGTITFTPCNPELSAAYDGPEISSYEFTATGASGTSNMTNPDTASWTYPLTANQQYRWSCMITDDLGRETHSYRRVFVNPSEIDFALNDISGDFDASDWSFEVTVYSDASTIQDRALVTLFLRDYHGGVLDNIGKLAGYENILATGWVDGESIVQDANSGEVTFTVHGPAFWMEKLPIDTIELSNMLEDEFVVPTKWTQVQAMTVDKALARVIYWMSTATLFMDCFFTDDEKKMRFISAPSGNMLTQIQSISNVIFARPLVNNYGQMFIEVDVQVADSDTQDALTVVLDITDGDFEAPLDIEKTNSKRTSMLQLSALLDADGVNDLYVHSRAPGHATAELGVFNAYENYVVADSAECRRIAGQLFELENNPYEPITLVFPGSIRLFDIAPRMYATITTDGSLNPRGIELVSQRLIPRRVEYTFENGEPATLVTFEVGVTGVDGVDYFPPIAQDDNLDDGLEDFGDIDFPALDDFFTETVPSEVTTPCDRDMGNYFTLNFSPRIITGSTSDRIAKVYFPCKVRAAGGLAGDTYIDISYVAHGDAETEKAAYAFKGDTRVLTGTWSGNRITFSPVSDTEVDGFEIEINEGAGAVISSWALGKLVEIGDIGDPTTACVNGQYYALEAYQGYWQATFPAEIIPLFFYNFTTVPTSASYLAGVGRDGFGDFHLQVPTFGSYVEPAGDDAEFNPDTQQFEIAENYGRIYFLSGVGGDQRELHAADALTLGLSYSADPPVKWALYEAQAIGRQIVIGSTILHNVCKLDEE